MPRIQRGPGDGIIYYVINRANGRQEVFHKELESSIRKRERPMREVAAE
jgi:hypothetical protein